MPERRPRLISIIGARPEIIQAAPVSAALAPLAEEILVHTGQHYDDAHVRGADPRHRAARVRATTSASARAGARSRWSSPRRDSPR